MLYLFCLNVQGVFSQNSQVQLLKLCIISGWYFEDLMQKSLVCNAGLRELVGPPTRV